MPTLPTIELVGSAGRIVVNAAEEAMWRAKGYKRADEVVKKDEDSISFEEMTKRELYTYAAEKQLDIPDYLNKRELIAAIREAEASKGEE